jgi:hypothetical protein
VLIVAGNNRTLREVRLPQRKSESTARVSDRKEEQQ